MDFNTLNLSPTASGSLTPAASTAASSNNEAGSQDRFLKLLVAQMKNQDPLNPMDNAQVTSQMAQIQTVSGVEKLNATVAALNAQFVQLQALSSASLVGRGVLVDGDRLAAVNGKAQGGFDLASPADKVKVEVLNGAGRVIDTIDLGALNSGRHSFEWNGTPQVDPAQAARFRVSSTLGATVVQTTTLTHDRVSAVSNGPEGLTLELDNAGPVAYASIKAFD
jgi:flagellar basal-body rod modification protein FlgD